ncbi:hypothetical protein ACQ4LE_010851 [Meloidogyne hapla]
MDRLLKFEGDLVDEICASLLGEDHLISDVKKHLNLSLDEQHAKEMRKASLKHFYSLSKKSMLQAGDEYNFEEKLARLNEQIDNPCSSSSSDVDLDQSFNEVTWPVRRPLLLEYQKKLQDYRDKLKAELNEEELVLSKIVDRVGK